MEYHTRRARGGRGPRFTRFRRPDGGVVAELAIDDARFGLADESPEAFNLSPESLGSASVRISMIVADPDDTEGV